MNRIKKKVLVIEDEKALVNALVHKLESAGYDVRSEGNGKSGLSRALDWHPDVILLDILLPKMDGLAALEKLREDAWGRTACVIMLTNVQPSDDASVQTIAKCEPSFYIVKSSSSLENIVEKIESALGHQQST